MTSYFQYIGDKSEINFYGHIMPRDIPVALDKPYEPKGNRKVWKDVDFIVEKARGNMELEELSPDEAKVLAEKYEEMNKIKNSVKESRTKKADDVGSSPGAEAGPEVDLKPAIRKAPAKKPA